ncbi:asparagine synthetase B family protein [Sediminibacterium ginsengisoli]|uniref:asparagine synthase (glutamine-hydrolyzing) n=1 Tax=Sediminibacterium ginsengisoli TaxID=413434 RepID=A0A1T4P8W1_9BACT|nr:asparagine synthase-related protein [Sediminibacterium ginsengisoli]SJZ88010.1 asparagine synthase (glutamine-hydrolysing) [Sediminibacterium ginsengisoli]
MSAIYGILHEQADQSETEAIKKMRASLAHCVMDGEGYWHGSPGSLGFCKMALYAQQENEKQPFESGDLVIVADCRLDNRDTLVKQLCPETDRTSQHSDPELILRAYLRWGTACVHHLDGEFAFAILNKESRELFAATDPVGFRPFFYTTEPGRFLFCSQIKGIVAAMNGQRDFDEEHLFNHLFRLGNQEHTYVKGIRALCGGKTLQFRDGIYSVHTYWQLAAGGKYQFKNDAQWLEQFRELLIRSVEKRINVFGNTGISLSGGLDSGTVAGIMATVLAKKNKPLYAFSSALPVNYQGIERDERYYIDSLNRMFPNIIQTYVNADNTGPFDPVEKAFAAEENIPNGYFYMEQAILNAAKENDVRTLFTGIGGDGGVTTHASGIYLLVNRGAFASAFRIAKSLAAYDNSSVLSVLRHDYLSHTTAWQRLRPKRQPAAGNHLQPAFLEPYLSRIDAVRRQKQTDMNNAGLINNGKVGRIITMFTNRNSMHGISSCDPLYDKDLLEFLSDAPVHLYTIGGQRRGLVRAVIEDFVPPEIRWRKNKLPYGPDAVRRALSHSADMVTELSNSKYDFIFDRFFSRQGLISALQQLRPYGPGATNKIPSLMTIHSVQAVRTLAHLRELGFSC